MESKKKKIIIGSVIGVIIIGTILSFVLIFNKKKSIQIVDKIELDVPVLHVTDDYIYTKEKNGISVKNKKMEEINFLPFKTFFQVEKENLVFQSDGTYIVTDLTGKTLVTSKRPVDFYIDSATQKNYFFTNSILYNTNGQELYSNIEEDFYMNYDFIVISHDSVQRYINFETNEEFTIDTENDSRNMYLNKALVFYKNGKYSIYFLDKKEWYQDTFESVKREGRGYIFSNEAKEVYLSNKGELLDKKEELSKEKVSKEYYLDYINSDCGIIKKESNGETVSDVCVYDYEISPFDSNWILWFENNDLRGKFSVFPDGKIIEGDGKFVGKYLVINSIENDSTLYNSNGEEQNAFCPLFSEQSDYYICQDFAYMSILDKDLKEVSDYYDYVECNDFGYCKIEKDGLYGLWYQGKVVIEPVYMEIYFSSDRIVGNRIFGSDIFVLGNSKESKKVESTKFIYEDIDIDFIIEKYELEEIKSAIDENRDFFKKYAYIITHNEGLKGYEKYLFSMFIVLADNKAYLDEDYFLNQLSLLSIELIDELDGAAGTYTFNNYVVSIQKEYEVESVIYHELMHFIDFCINKETEYFEKDNRILTKEEYKQLSISEKKKVTFSNYIENFLVEGGAEFFTSTYFENGHIWGYESLVNIYQALTYIYGYDTISEIFFSSNGKKKMQELLQLNNLQFGEFLNLCSSTYSNDLFYSIDSQTIVSVIDYLVDFYKKEKGDNWQADTEFIFLLSRFLPYDRENVESKYLEEYDLIEGTWTTLLKKILQEHDINDATYLFYYIDDEIHGIVFKVEEENKYGVLKMEYDFKNEKIGKMTYKDILLEKES